MTKVSKKVKTMTFFEVIKKEGKTPGLKYRRVDYDAHWYLWFDNTCGGLMRMTPDGGSNKVYPVEIYHHDFMDGKWVVTEKRQ